MKDMSLNHTIEHLYNSTAKELYNFAINVFGNYSYALQISIDTFVKAFAKMAVHMDIIDSELFMNLNIRLLYKYGKMRKFRVNKNSKSAQCNIIICNSERTKLSIMLDCLNYNERFILLLFCCQKLRIERISNILRLPNFLVAKWLLSAARKISIYNLKQLV